MSPAQTVLCLGLVMVALAVWLYLRERASARRTRDRAAGRKAP